jgi:proline-specific peptidase
MGELPSYDGTHLAYHENGVGAPLICLPGGPARASRYLGDLGGLSAHRRLVLLDQRGTGKSAIPDDPVTYRCDRIVEDVEALRAHLGLEQVDILGHSAAGNIVTLYAARYPQRVASAVLVAPGWRASGLEFSDDEWFGAMRRRRHEPWFATAFAAMNALNDGDVNQANRLAAAPLWFGRWTDAAREYMESEPAQVSRQAQDGFRVAGAFGDPARTRAALAGLSAPVLLLGGELDPAPTPRLINEFAELFPNATAVIQPAAGHTPWIDDPREFVDAVAGFLNARRPDPPMAMVEA